MQIRSITVTDFRCIGHCEVKLGRGLNVIYGDNALGKSTLAESIRAAFLVQTGTKHGESFQPWEGGGVPTVEIEFEADGALWRVSKSFGSGRRGKALLEVSRSGHPFRTEAKGRSVDGSLRELLGWGLASPGGKGRSTKPTFLVTALLANQGEVDSLFSSTLDEDPITSGRDLITHSLDVVGQDPLVGRLLDSTVAKLEKVISVETGRPRTKDSSPLQQSAARVREAERLLKNLQTSSEDSAQTMDDLRQAVRARDIQQEQHEAAQQALAALTARSEEHAQRSGAEQRLQQAREALQKVEAAVAAIAAKEVAINAAKQNLADREAACESANAGRGKAVRLFETLRERARVDEAEREKLAAIAQSEGEKEALELRQRLAEANGKVEAAQAAESARERAEVQAGELARLEARCNKMSLEVDLCELRLQIEQLEADLDAIRVLKQDEAAAALASTEANRKVEAADEVRRAAEQTAKDREESFEALRQELEKTLGGEQRRAAELQSARSGLLDQEGKLRRSEQELERHRLFAEKVSLLRQCQNEVAAKQQQLLERNDALEENERASKAGRQSVRDCENVVVARSLHEALERLRGLEAREQAALGLRDRVAEATSSHAAASQQAQARERVSREQVERMRMLVERRAQHESEEPQSAAFPAAAALGVAFGVGAVVAVLGVVLVGAEFISFAAAAAAAGAGFLGAGFIIRGRRLSVTRSAWQGRGRELESQWALEAEPVLRTAGVADAKALAAYREASEGLSMQAESESERVRSLERELRDVDVSPDALAAARREVAEVEARLMVADRDRLLQRAAQAPEALELHRAVTTAQSALEDLSSTRQRLLEEQMQVKASHQAESVQCAALESETERLQAGLDPETSVGLLEAALASAGVKREEHKRVIDALEATTEEAAAEAQQQLSEKQTQRDEARSLVAVGSEASAAARETAAEAKAKLESAQAMLKGHQEEELRASLASLSTELERHDAPAQMQKGAEVDQLTLAKDREALDALKQELEGRRPLLRRDSQEAEELMASLGERPAQIIEAASGVAEELRSRLATLERVAETEAPQPEPEPGPELEDWIDPLREVQQEAEQSEERLVLANQARELAAGDVQRLAGELEELKRAAAEHDLGQTRDAAESAAEALGGLPVVEEIADVAREQTESDLKLAVGKLRAAEGQLRELQGKLQHAGGAVLDERLAEQKQIVERQHQRHRDLEEDYEGYKLLYDTLKELDSNRASHLGRALGKPITEKFLELAGDRFTSFRMDPSLRAEGVVVGGAVRKLNALSVGTREQLASLVRLAIAQHLGTALVLDDQLVHSDEKRMRWFSQELRRVGGEIQIIVLTCRPSDYLKPSEMLAAGAVPDWEEKAIAAVDLETVIRDNGEPVQR